MKFVQLSTIASLAVFAAAPGVSAAGLRAHDNRSAVNKEEETTGNSDRRKLYGLPTGQRMGIPPGMFPHGVFPGESQTYGVPNGQNFGIPAHMGMDNTFPGGDLYRPSAGNNGIPPAFEDLRHQKTYSPETNQHQSGYVTVSKPVLREYCRYLSNLSSARCNSTPECTNYCASDSVTVSAPVYQDWKDWQDSHHNGGEGHDDNQKCAKFGTEQACHAHHHWGCGWDNSLGCHPY